MSSGLPSATGLARENGIPVPHPQSDLAKNTVPSFIFAVLIPGVSPTRKN
jgi:hypothetical protein